MAAYLDASSLEFLDKEIFTDVTAGEKHEVDLIAKARFKGEETFFLVHVEAQASSKPEFPKRMFAYFARLHQKYDLPIYPVVIFSYDTPLVAAPKKYRVAFPGKTVLQFEYAAIQLNRLSWRKFLQTPNPVANALMAKMRIAPKDRVTVRRECMRMLRTLKLDPAKSQLIGGFIELYLKLNAEEMQQYERQIANLPQEEQEDIMQLMTTWGTDGYKKGIQAGWQDGVKEGRQAGLKEGRQEGKEEMLVRQIRKRFGVAPDEITARLDLLTPDQLNELGEALFDFSTLTDLENWLSGQTR